MNFTDDQKKTITRRQLNILLENATHDITIASILSQRDLLLEVDSANNVYYNNYEVQAKSYETEYRALAGTIAGTYPASDILAAAIDPTIPPFFPTSPMYFNLIPKVIGSQKGLFNPTGTDATREDNFIGGLTPYSGALGALNFAIGSGVYAAFIIVDMYSASGLVILESPILLGYSVGDYVITKDGSNDNVIMVINNIDGFGPFQYQCTLITGTVPLSLTSVSSYRYVGFTQIQRQFGLTGFNDAISDLRTYINSQLNLHKIYIQNSVNALNSQNDTRSPQATQNATAMSSAFSIIAAENSWQALSVNNAMGTIESLLPIINVRASFIATRKAQIIFNLGSSSSAAIFQNGENFTTSILGNTYFMRYKWLNARINRASGSLRRYYSGSDSANAVQNLKTQNILLLEEYNLSFNTKRIVQLNQTTLLNLDNNIGLNINDEVSIVSDTQPIVKRVIAEVIGTTEIRLNYPIPAAYVPQEKVRLFKEL